MNIDRIGPLHLFLARLFLAHLFEWCKKQPIHLPLDRRKPPFDHSNPRFVQF